MDTTYDLDTVGFRAYSAVMFWRSVAALFVALWLVLLGIEFSEDMGFINYDGPQMDHRVEATLASLGEAIQISDDLQIAVPCAVSAHALGFIASVAPHEVSCHLIQREAAFPKTDVPIYKLDRSLLI